MAASSPVRETRIGVCNLCEAICGLALTVERASDGSERVTEVRGHDADPLSRGHVCPKAFALADVLEDPDRLRHPVRRVPGPDGDRWERLGWDEALDLVARGLADAVNRHGRDALALYLGNPNVHSLGAMTHGTALAGSFRTRNKFSATSVDQLPQQLVARLLYGHQLLLPVPDLDRTDLFVVVGANPMASNGSLMTAPDFPGRLRDLQSRGGRMVVLDPRRTETARRADEHHFVRPGTDAYLLLAMLHVVLDEGLATPPPWVDGVTEVADAVAEFTPALAAERTGVDAEVVVRLARELATTPRAVLYGRMGVSTQEFGTVCAWAVQTLNLLTGHVDVPGGALVTSPAVDVVGRGIVGRGHHGLWHSRVRGLPEFSGELPVAALAEEIRTPGDGQVRALLTVAGNPVSSTPDGAGLAAVLPDLDFMASVDLYVNETTRHADVILPTTTALERDHYDLVFHALAVRNTARFTPAVLRPGPEARHDWQVFAALHDRVQRLLDDPRPRRRRWATSARLRLSPTRLLAVLLATGRRTTLRRLRRTPGGVDLGPLAPSFPGGLQTRDHRVDLAQPLVLDELARLRTASGPRTTRDELLLIGRRHQRDNNSWLHNTPRLTRGRPRHHLLAHPEDLAARGIADGTQVRVTSRVGSVVVEVAATEDVMPGVVSLPHGYGHAAQGAGLTHATTLPGVSVNDLTDPELLDVSGNAALNGVPVRISPA
ncbi:MAG: molybdopterin-dependent oxidoreductase [Nocardioides sp.]|nr:molybdopterin-dependent oxidoreductase [Nocardioides sp.]